MFKGVGKAVLKIICMAYAIPTSNKRMRKNVIVNVDSVLVLW
jgi:hypothetical protein